MNTIPDRITKFAIEADQLNWGIKNLYREVCRIEDCDDLEHLLAEAVASLDVVYGRLDAAKLRVNGGA